MNLLNNNMDYLILRAEFINPPSEKSALRDLMLFASILKLKSLIEIDKEWVDIYYKEYKNNLGLMDFVKDFIFPGDLQDQLRIDYKLRYPLSIVIDKIVLENRLNLIGQISSYAKIKY